MLLFFACRLCFDLNHVNLDSVALSNIQKIISDIGLSIKIWEAGVCGPKCNPILFCQKWVSLYYIT